MDYKEVVEKTKEFNQKFAFANKKVIFKIPLTSYQNFISKPELRPNIPFVYSYIYPYFTLKNNELWYCHRSQTDISGNFYKVDYKSLMTEDEYKKFIDGLEYFDKNLKRKKHE